MWVLPVFFYFISYPPHFCLNSSPSPFTLCCAYRDRSQSDTMMRHTIPNADNIAAARNQDLFICFHRTISNEPNRTEPTNDSSAAAATLGFPSSWGSERDLTITGADRGYSKDISFFSFVCCAKSLPERAATRLSEWRSDGSTVEA